MMSLDERLDKAEEMIQKPLDTISLIIRLKKNCIYVRG